MSLVKLLLLKQTELSVKIHRRGQFGSVDAYIIRCPMKNIASSTVKIGFLKQMNGPKLAGLTLVGVCL